MSRHKRTLTIAPVVLVVSLAVWARGRQGPTATSGMQSSAAQSNSNASGELHFKAPDGWVTEKASPSAFGSLYCATRIDEEAFSVTQPSGALKCSSPEAFVFD